VTRMNIAPIIRRNQIEDLMNVKGIGEKSFLKLYADAGVRTVRVTVATSTGLTASATITVGIS
jgi:hypothetical protein